MKALILRNDADDAVASARALLDQGFKILCVENRDIAETLIRMDQIDLILMDEQVDGYLTHGIALSGERKNPYISSIIVTDRASEETNDLYELIPSLYALVGKDTAPTLVAQLATCSVINTGDVSARVRENLAADAAEELAPDDLLVDEAEVASAIPLPEFLQTTPIVAEPARPAPAPIVFPQVAAAPALITVPEEATTAASTDDDEIEIPSYDDVVFATPALAELARAYCHNEPKEMPQVETVDKIGPVLPSFNGVAGQQPLVLTSTVPQGAAT